MHLFEEKECPRFESSALPARLLSCFISAIQVTKAQFLHDFRNPSEAPEQICSTCAKKPVTFLGKATQTKAGTPAALTSVTTQTRPGARALNCIKQIISLTYPSVVFSNAFRRFESKPFFCSKSTYLQTRFFPGNGTPEESRRDLFNRRPSFCCSLRGPGKCLGASRPDKSSNSLFSSGTNLPELDGVERRDQLQYLPRHHTQSRNGDHDRRHQYFF